MSVSAQGVVQVSGHHAAVFCRVSVGLFSFSVWGRCVASRLRKVTASHCLPYSYTVSTPGKRSGRWRTFERRQLRTSVWTLLSLCACTFRAVRERDVQSPDVRSRERACPCLHRVWCRSSRSFLLSCQCVFFLSVRSAVWRRVCGR